MALFDQGLDRTRSPLVSEIILKNKIVSTNARCSRYPNLVRYSDGKRDYSQLFLLILRETSFLKGKLLITDTVFSTAINIKLHKWCHTSRRRWEL